MTRDLTPSHDVVGIGRSGQSSPDRPKRRPRASPPGHTADLRVIHCAEDAQTDPAMSLWPTISGELEPGVHLSDRYRVLELLAAGGMSRLYLAEQVGLERPVVLKTIFREFVDDARSLQGFLQEARVLARINHPNIVSVYGVGATSAGERYIAMEYVPGESLDLLLKREHRLSLRRTVSILLQLARALAAVHREGVIHRDIKPANVLMLEKRAGVDVAKLSDFGLAKIVKRPSSADTQQGVILGTPQYMAPEQIRARTIDHRADLYSLGCVAYEMLTGQPPFPGSRMAALNGHLHDLPKPMHRVCPRANIPPSFQAFVDRALAKDPKNRFGSAFELYAALLATADAAGIPRRELRLVESLFDDPAYALVHEGARRRTLSALRIPRARAETWLRWIVFAVVAFTIGVGVGQLTSRTMGARSPHAGALTSSTRIVVTQPHGEYVSLDGDTWKRVPTSFDLILPGEHELRFGAPSLVRETVSVRVGVGQTLILSEPSAPPTD